MAELQKAKRVVQGTMKHRAAKLLFNQPVDPEALGLPDYFKIVKHPMDLGTILQRLAAGGQYSSPSQVKKDVKLVWKNCLLYNSRPEDQPTRDLCTEVQQHFEKLWSEAGLVEQPSPSTTAPAPQAVVIEVDESGVPDQYNIVQGEELPARLVSNFAILAANNLEKLVPLKRKNKTAAVLRGTLLATDEGRQKAKKRQVHVVCTGPIIDWCFQYGDAPGIWVITDQAWYKLVAPAEEYAEVHSPAAQKLAVCGAAVREAQQDPDLEVSEAVDRALAAQADNDKPNIKLRQLVELQLRSWIQDRLQGEDDYDSDDQGDFGQVNGGRQDKRRASDEGSAGIELEGSARRKRRKTGTGVYMQAPAAENGESAVEESANIYLPADDTWSPGAGMTARQRSKDVAARRAMLEAKASAEAPKAGKKPGRAKREREADAGRGPPPAPARSFRAPPEHVPDLIMVWELLQTLGGLLQIAAFPLWRLEAALFPGPHPKPEQPQTEAEAQAASTKASPQVAPALNQGEANTSAGSQDLAAQHEESATSGGQAQATQHEESATSGGQAQATQHEDLATSGGQAQATQHEDLATSGGQAQATQHEHLATSGGQAQATQHENLATSGGHMETQAVEPADGDKTAEQAARIGEEEEDVTKTSLDADTVGQAAGASGLDAEPVPPANSQTLQQDPEEEARGDVLHLPDGPDAVEPMLAGEHNPEAEQVILRKRRKKRKPGRPPKPGKLPNRSASSKTGMKVHLRMGGTEISRKSSKGDAGSLASRSVPQPSVAVDREVIASAIVLREVHCALLRAVEGAHLSPDALPPSTAQLLLQPEAQASQAQWCQRVVNAILASAEPIEPEASEAALHLAYGEYWQLSPQQRLALLRSLAYLALSVETVRDHIQAQAETALLPLQRAAQVEGAGAESGFAAGVPSVPPPGSVAEWEAWKKSIGVSMRKPLGMDYAKRRYWAIGGRAAAWRIYVEEDEGAAWGWYEGKQLCGLVDWLRKGSIDREAALLRALAKAPLPRKFVSKQLQRPSPGVPLELPDAASAVKAGDEHAASAMVGAAELSSKRSDGMRGGVAPLLRGEGSWPKTDVHSPFQKRIFHCVDALLGDIPFWFKGPGWVARHVALLESVRTAHTTAALGPALQQVEDVLFTNACLDEEWPRLWRGHWRSEVIACTHLQECLLYTAALQEHVVRQRGVMPRSAFDKLARESNCQLHFPWPDEAVVVLRSGVLQHFSRYMQSLGLEAPIRHAAEMPAAQAPSSMPAPQGDNLQLATQVLDPEIHAQVPQSHPSAHHEPSPAGEGHEHAGTPVEVDHGPSGTESTPGPSISDQQGKQQREEEAEGADAVENDKPPQAVFAAQEQPPPQGFADPEADTQHMPVDKAVQSESPQPDSLQASSILLQAELPESLVTRTTGTVTPDAAVAGTSSAGEEPLQAPTPAAQLPTNLRELLRTQWQELKGKAISMRHVERFYVASIAYRRNLFEGSAAEMLSQEGDDNGEAASDAARWPVAWLLLRPMLSGPQHQVPVEDLVLPLRIDLALPDFLTTAEEYDASMQRRWTPGQRFRMFFGGKTHFRSRAGGVYYKGTIADVKPRPAPDAPQAEQAAYDPWEAVRVEWDASRGHAAGECENVSPWEIERDPDDIRSVQEPLPSPEEGLQRAARKEGLPPQRFDQFEGFGVGRKRRLEEEDDDWDPAGAESPQSSGGGGGEWKPSRAERAAARQKAAMHASDLSTAVPQEALETLQPLSKERFVMLLGNWHRLNRGKFKVPIFAHQELDLHRVFWEVQARGGSDMVTAEKMWKEVCRSLDVDLTGQTSASYNMRLNYERCLLEFEQYLASGQYMEDLAAGQAPSPDHVQHQVKGLPAGRESSVPGGMESVGVTTRRSRDPRHQEPPPQSTLDVSGSAAGLGLESGFSFTKLLGLDDEGLASGGPIAPPPLSGTIMGPDHLAPPWRRLVAPPGVIPSPHQDPSQGWVAAVFGVPPALRLTQQPSAAVLPASHPDQFPGQYEVGGSLGLMAALVAALQGGQRPKALHQMVDRAAASLGLPVTAEPWQPTAEPAPAGPVPAADTAAKSGCEPVQTEQDALVTMQAQDSQLPGSSPDGGSIVGAPQGPLPASHGQATDEPQASRPPTAEPAGVPHFATDLAAASEQEGNAVDVTDGNQLPEGVLQTSLPTLDGPETIAVEENIDGGAEEISRQMDPLNGPEHRALALQSQAESGAPSSVVNVSREPSIGAAVNDVENDPVPPEGLADQQEDSMQLGQEWHYELQR